MENLQKALATLPSEPGVYLYRSSKGTVIYVGKARDLSKRVRQYFQKGDAVGIKTVRLVSEIHSIETILTTSEFDALLLEAKLIREFLPKYNVASRDDKSPLYVIITMADPLPRLLLVRKGDVPLYEKHKKNAIYGPFQSAYALRNLLRQLRSIVPYCTQKERRGKRCFYTHLGLCDPCPAEIVRMEGERKADATKRYRKHMQQLKALFDGRTKWLATMYEKEMLTLAKDERFEEANMVKHRLAHLTMLSSHRYDPQVFLERGALEIFEEELNELIVILKKYYPTLTGLERIECVDISNLYGHQAVGSLVVLTNGRPDKKEYRKFRIHTVTGISDVAMMREVLTRRFKHPEWPTPNFLLVDGGKPQVQVAREVLASLHLSLPVAGLAKREEELIFPNDSRYHILRLPFSGKAIKVVQRIRDEAHRFAITYHRLLRGKAFLSRTKV